MVGVDVRTTAWPADPSPIQGEQGPPGDPTELLASLSPGDALTVDDQGAPDRLAVPTVVRHGETPTGRGVELIFGPDGDLDNITIDGVDA